MQKSGHAGCLCRLIQTGLLGTRGRAGFLQALDDAVRAGKRLFNLVADADQKTILLHESKEQGALIGTPNQVEAVMSNMQKRAANYSD